MKITIITTICLTVAMFLLSGCENRWNGVYYPEGLGYGVDEDKWEYSTIYPTKDDCLNWCRQKLSSSSNPEADCECGKNCKAKGGMQICEETTDAY